VDVKRVDVDRDGEELADGLGLVGDVREHCVQPEVALPQAHIGGLLDLLEERDRTGADRPQHDAEPRGLTGLGLEVVERSVDGHRQRQETGQVHGHVRAHGSHLAGAGTAVALKLG
jgi:hypothetical protein